MRQFTRALIGAALLFSLTAPAHAAPAPGPAVSADDAAKIKAIETGLLPAILVKGEPAPVLTLADRMTALHVPGVSIAFFENGRIVWTRAYGRADVERGTQVTPDTLFQAGSISKPLAAMAALRLVQDGRLDLDQDVNTRLKGWQVPAGPMTATEKVTLRRLLSHTAGLSVHGFVGYNRTAPRATLPQVLSGQKPANSPAVVSIHVPGAQFDYSGGGYTAAQLLMEETTGQPFAAILKATVLDPAGLKASTYEQPLPEALQGRATLGYRASGKPVLGGWNVYPEQAAAGLWTTPSDIARFAIELQNEAAGTSHNVLSPDMARTMLTPGKGAWGLGLNVMTDGAARFGHGGANEGFRNDFVAFTGGTRQGVAIMTNSDSGSSLISEIERAVAKAYGWPAYRQMEVTPVAVRPDVLAADAGTYEVAGFGRVAVTVTGGALFVTLPVLAPAPVEARSSSDNAFFIAAIGVTGVFQRGADGSVTGLFLMTPFGPFSAKKLTPAPAAG